MDRIYSDLSTLSDNEEWQRRLRGAYSRRLKGEAKDRPVALIDFKRPDRNRYHVVRQFKVEAQRTRIADLVVFVNGIPLVVIEAKCPLKAADAGAVDRHVVGIGRAAEPTWRSDASRR
ncbi:type I restriction endonuclease [Brevundimonas sp. 'scallop']|uniref:type I restriction endonuclease n=1 Tax=Brevundimonas sp. 'scallop' TaxID=2562582 RepID=UPI00197AA818|nr:type I restriction endonuclease [Brevundimonas sp. 'scallop']